jgi:hypothetical protein
MRKYLAVEIALALAYAAVAWYMQCPAILLALIPLAAAEYFRRRAKTKAWTASVVISAVLAVALILLCIYVFKAWAPFGGGGGGGGGAPGGGVTLPTPPNGSGVRAVFIETPYEKFMEGTTLTIEAMYRYAGVIGGGTGGASGDVAYYIYLNIDGKRYVVSYVMSRSPEVHDGVYNLDKNGGCVKYGDKTVGYIYEGEFYVAGWVYVWRPGGRACDVWIDLNLLESNYPLELVPATPFAAPDGVAPVVYIRSEKNATLTIYK